MDTVTKIRRVQFLSKSPNVGRFLENTAESTVFGRRAPSKGEKRPAIITQKLPAKSKIVPIQEMQEISSRKIMPDPIDSETRNLNTRVRFAEADQLTVNTPKVKSNEQMKAEDQSAENHSSRSKNSHHNETSTLEGLSPRTKTKKLLERSISKLSPQDYFADDDTNDRNKTLHNIRYFYYNSDVRFSLKQYSEFLIHHLLFFTFGPCCLLLALFSKKLRILYRNLRFFGFEMVVLLQYLLYSCLLFTCYLHYLKRFDADTSVDICTVRNLCIMLILTLTSVATKYGSYPARLIEKYKDVKISKEDYFRELMIGAWSTQGPEIRHKKTSDSIERLEIDEAIFLIAFMVRPSPERTEQLIKVAEEQKEMFSDHRKARSLYLLNNKVFEYIRGRILFDFILKEFKQNTEKNRISNWAFGFSFSVIWVSANLALRFFIKEEYLIGQDWVEMFAFLFSSVLCFLVTFKKMQFYLRSLIDLDRKTFIMNQCGFMINPLRVSTYSTRKILPTIHLLDRISLNSWFHLRRLGIDYGRKFFIRQEAFIVQAILISFCCLLTYGVLLYMRYFYNAFQFNYNIIYRLLWLLSLDTLFFAMLSFLFMFKAGKLNAEYQTHIYFLKRIKSILMDLLEHKDYYFDNLGKNRTASFQLDLFRLAEIRSQSFIHNCLKIETEHILGDHIQSDLVSFLTSVIKLYGNLISQLEDEETANSIKILGFVLSRTSVLNVIILIVSLVLTAWELFFGK